MYGTDELPHLVSENEPGTALLWGEWEIRMTQGEYDAFDGDVESLHAECSVRCVGTDQLTEVHVDTIADVGGGNLILKIRANSDDFRDDAWDELDEESDDEDEDSDEDSDD